MNAIDRMERLSLGLQLALAPCLLVFAITAAHYAWHPIMQKDPVRWALFCLGFSFVSAWWAIWGIIYAPHELERWWFALASVLNLVPGVILACRGEWLDRLGSALFLGYSLWLFFLFRRTVSQAPQKMTWTE